MIDLNYQAIIETIMAWTESKGRNFLHTSSLCFQLRPLQKEKITVLGIRVSPLVLLVLNERLRVQPLVSLRPTPGFQQSARWWAAPNLKL